MNTPYNVAVQEDGYVFLLSIEGFRSMAETERAIAWQRVGDFHQIMYVCRPSLRGIGRFCVVSSHCKQQNMGHRRKPVGTLLRPRRGSWNKDAWRGLLQRSFPKTTLSHQTS